MWWMMLPCLLIVVLLLFAGGGISIGSWPLIAIIGFMVGAHLWMMFRGHGHGSSDDDHAHMTGRDQASQENIRDDEKKGRSNHSGCH